MTELDKTELLLVGGAPRSGTTALARMLSLHPEVASTGTETGAVKILSDLQDCLNSSPAIDRDGLGTYLERWLIGIKLQLEWNIKNFNLQRDAFALNSAPTRLLAEEIRDDIVTWKECTADQTYSSQLLTKLMIQLCSKSQLAGHADILLEKSPNNSEYLSNLITRCNKPKIIIVTRNPIPTIASMRNRSIGKDPWSGAFHGHALKLVWIYISHYRILCDFQAVNTSDWLTLQEPGSSNDHIFPINYERMCFAPMQAAAELALQLKLELSNIFLCSVKNQILLTSQFYTSAEFDASYLFTPTELFFLEALQEVMEKVAHLKTPSQRIKCTSVNVPTITKPCIIDCQGVYNEATGQKIIDNNAVFCVVARESDKKIRFRAFCSSLFPSKENRLSIKAIKPDQQKELLLSSITIKPSETIEHEIELDQSLSAACKNGIYIYYIRLKSDHAYIPILLSRDLEDERILSLSIEFIGLHDI